MTDNFKISLKAARVNAGFTLEEVAKSLHRGKQTIHNWESGRTPIPGYELQRVCDLYGAPIDRIFLPEESSLT